MKTKRAWAVVLGGPLLVVAAACGQSTPQDAATTGVPETPAPRSSAEVPQTETTASAAASFDPALCAPETLERDLEIGPEQAAFTATVDYCEAPGWAVISWDSPGDSQRIAQVKDGAWETYVVFPNDVCRTQARTEGVPEELMGYFTEC